MAIENLLARGLSGHPLALAARALGQPRVAALGAEVFRRALGIDALASLIEGNERLEPDVAPRAGRPPRDSDATLEVPRSPTWATTSSAFTSAYGAGALDPEQVLERLLLEADRLTQRQPLLRCLWTRDEAGARQAARASAERYKRGAPLGPLDGVPVLVKEQLAVRGLAR